MNDYNLIILSAFRYALGRMTYIVDVVCRYIKANIGDIDDYAIELMIKEIGEAKVENRLGMECDQKDWLDLAYFLEDEIVRR